MPITLFIAGCGANEGVLQAGKETPSSVNAANEKTFVTAETEVEAMRTAGFNYIFVLRRKDNGILNPEDREIIKVNTTVANRRVFAEEGKAFVVGANPVIPQYNIGTLEQRFFIANHSLKPIPVLDVNINANLNK